MDKGIYRTLFHSVSSEFKNLNDISVSKVAIKNWKPNKSACRLCKTCGKCWIYLNYSFVLNNRRWVEFIPLLALPSWNVFTLFIYFFSIWVFFHVHSRITGPQGKGEGISLTPHYHFHPPHRHADPLHRHFSFS